MLVNKHKHYPGDVKREIAVVSKMAFLILFALVTLFPFYWVILSSFKESNEIYTNAVGMPREFAKYIVQNYINAFTFTDALRVFLNSLFYSLVAVAVILLVTSIVSYVISRIVKSRWLFVLFSLGIMVPIQALIIPLDVVLKNLGVVNSRAGIIIAFVASSMSFSVFIMTVFMRGIPSELEDAAFIDGCTRVQIFSRIILPISGTALATSATFSFLNCWNDLLLSMTILQSSKLLTLNLAVYRLHGEFVTDYGEVTAGIVMLIIPAMVMYLIFQEQVVKGVTSGAVKG
jgi:raffinose/stachyose/melibiose transport system permease protein